MKFDVVGIESPCVDLAVSVECFPSPNSGSRVLGNSWQGGGKVATGMVAAARLGAYGAIIGDVGDDAYGRFCMDDFLRHGIDTRHLLKRRGETTPFSVVISDKKTMGRSVLYYTGQKPSHQMTVGELPEDYLAGTEYLYISAVNPLTLAAMEKVKKAGGSVFIDADSYSEGDEQGYPMIDIFIGSEFYYKALFGGKRTPEENCRNMQKKGPGIVIFTMGEKGCFGIEGDQFFEVPAYSVPVVDTLGAGDVFHGAFLAEYLRCGDARSAAVFASAVSAIKCTRVGGRAGIPDRKTTLGFMETGKIDYREINKRVRFYQGGLF